MRTGLRFSVSIAALVAIAAPSALAGPGTQLAIVRYRTDGSLDPTFGSNGVVLTSFGHRFQAGDAVALEPKGRIVVVGWTSNGTTTRSAIARFLTGGALDPSFGGDGRITLDLSRSDEQFD